jgi:phospholipid/cholesterol/gamma-HCH transport system substrate-binding protein
VTSSRPPYKTAGAVFLVLCAVVLVSVYYQFRGGFTTKTQLTMIAGRAGLVMDPGSKVTYNGVQIGQVAYVEQITQGGLPKAKLMLDVDPKYIDLIPANVDADIMATTVFGSKYVSFTSPSSPVPQRISPRDVIDVTSVTTEINTLFETVTSISEKVDPVKLNQTLTATAQALDGLGTKFGKWIVHGNDILADVNAQMPEIRADIQQLSGLADVYADASPDLWDFLQNAVSTARTINNQQSDVDGALLAAIGFGTSGADIVDRGAPYLVRGQAMRYRLTSCSTSTAPKSSAPSAITTMWRPSSRQPRAATATRRKPSRRSLALVIPTSIRTTCPGSTRPVVPRAGQAAGNRSPGICGRPPIS